MLTLIKFAINCGSLTSKNNEVFAPINVITMNNNTFPNNIKRYILQPRVEDSEDIDVDVDIDLFEITKLNFRILFDKSENQNITHTEIVFKFFELKIYLTWIQLLKSTSGILTIKGGNLLNPGTLHSACPSDATDNLLIGTFSDIEFESLNQEITDDRLASNLQHILRTNVFSNAFNEYHRKNIITNLLCLGFHLKYKLVKHIGSKAEATYRDNFLKYLFTPISEALK